MSGDVHVRFCERLGVQFPGPTHLKIHTGGNEGASDHGPFAVAGFNSAMLSECAPYSPYYHRRFDSVTDYNGNDVVMPDGTAYIDYPYAMKMLRGAVGWLAEAAVPAQ